MAATALTREELLSTIVMELASGIDAALEHWMARIEQVLQDPRYTPQEKLSSLREILTEYRLITADEQSIRWNA